MWRAPNQRSDGFSCVHHTPQTPQPATDTSRAYDPIAALPFDIYLVEGQPHKAGDLRRAGIETAYTCVILADRASVQVRRGPKAIVCCGKCQVISADS